jgi:shikimate kinase
LPTAKGFVINSGVTQGQPIQPISESDPTLRLALDRPVVLVGLMGAGKTRVGKRLAAHLELPFVDTDQEIEAETGKTISELFDALGEPEFRQGERRMIARLLQGPVSVIASGGGAFMDPVTRANIRARAISIWLKADLDALVLRTSRSKKRPLLQGVDPEAKLAELMELRHPIYAEADLTVQSLAGPIDETVEAVVGALTQHLETPR